jgi:hypothetical protein
LAETESIAENLSAALTGLNIEIGEIIEKALILAGQLKKAFLSLIMPREEKAIITLKNEYIIYRLITPRTRDYAF